MTIKKENVYVETSVISFLAARLTRDVVKLAKQEVTREWWQRHGPRFNLYISAAVVAEIKRGDAEAAKQRLLLIRGLPELDINDEVINLYERLIADKALPATAAADALHIAVAAVHGIAYLLTWNCTHINNAFQKPKIRTAVTRAGYEEPIMATPEELI
ncbi:MAG: type II toxin-antitoxin system VapC family toxin [Candidatus Adiutrix sp.]|nr:type II toxin-antitoxin system VapC family toxin [Candidatus Adiutrix sp.]